MTTQALSNSQFAAHMKDRRGDPRTFVEHVMNGYSLWKVSDGYVDWWVGASHITDAANAAQENALMMGAEDGDAAEWTTTRVSRFDALVTPFFDDDNGGNATNMWVGFLKTTGPGAQVIACSEW